MPAADGDRVAEALGDGDARVGAERQDPTVEGAGRVAGLVLVTAVADVDRPVVRDVERLWPMQGGGIEARVRL